MLKIEINGMVPSQADELRGRIAKQFDGAEYRGDVTVSVVNNFVFDLEGESQPYLHLRVFLTDREFDYSEDVARRLKIFNMDIEVIDL